MFNQARLQHNLIGGHEIDKRINSARSDWRNTNQRRQNFNTGSYPISGKSTLQISRDFIESTRGMKSGVDSNRPAVQDNFGINTDSSVHD